MGNGIKVCDVSVHNAFAFCNCHVMTLWNLIGAANLPAVEQSELEKVAQQFRQSITELEGFLACASHCLLSLCLAPIPVLEI